MRTAILLIGSVLQPPEKLPTLYIRIGDNHESRLLKSELTRNWFNVRSLRDYRTAYIYHREQQSIRAKIVFVEVDRWSELKSPAYKIGRYGKWEQFDRRAFEFTGRPVRTVRWIIDWHEAERVKPVWRKFDADGRPIYDYEMVPLPLPKPPWERVGQ